MQHDCDECSFKNQCLTLPQDRFAVYIAKKAGQQDEELSQVVLTDCLADRLSLACMQTSVLQYVASAALQAWRQDKVGT